MKFFLKVLKISITITLVIFFLEILFSGFNFEELLELETWLLYFSYSFILTYLNASYFWWFGAKITWENANIKKVLLGAFGSVILTLIGYFICRLLHHVVYEGVAFQEFFGNERMSFYLFPLLFTTIISLFFHLIYFYKALQEKKVKEQKIIAGTASAKFDALKNQLDPHFLFNSLNVLSALIDENPEQAQKFTSALSKVYRYVLEQKNKELVDLEEELKFAKTYMDLLKMRFEDAIVFNFPSVLKNPEAKVVPLSLQLLLENTIKHNTVNSENPLEISIIEEDRNLVVKNNLQPKAILKRGSGVGLSNIKQRYHLLTDRKIEIDNSHNVFIVKLPLLTKIVKMEKQAPVYAKEDAYLRAKKQVKAEREFYGNLTSYLIVIPVLGLFNYLTYSGFIWVVFPAIGWGIGVFFHGLSVFNYNLLLGKNWEERKIKELMQKDKIN
ncbi:histidine kinase [Salegentibacter sp. LM13S]|uniref:2TM domain-containing protein n=1 Tax=Salegentibacter lacus TaxID=2873599 RepID=UPI001CD02A4D|nr:2TM domain-containing protein [Salegentibacter lacus]MBZ9630199.1 histidine kinase [Salegentibacter lacus]